MSVYDIKVAMNTLDAGRWGNVLIGSIQNAVLTLEKAKMIEVLRVEKNGKRAKTIYKITKEGKKFQKQLLMEALSSLDIHYSSIFFLGLSRIEILSEDKKIELVEERRQKLLTEKEILKTGIENKKKYTELDDIQKISIESMFCTIDVQLNLVEKLLILWRKKSED